MRVALTGATGRAGWPILRVLRGAGHDVTTLGRTGADRTWRLGETPDLSDQDVLVHAAFSHVPGRYRGGEGSDPEGFVRLNRDGSLRIVAAAPRTVFLSSRAAYGDYPPGTRLHEDMPSRPDTLYGRAKVEVETAVTAAGGTSLRATGLYGPPPPGRAHKWAELFDAFARGETPAPRIATEVHADDLAAAVGLVLAPDAPALLNVSDILLDRRDLLSLWSEICGIRGSLPAAAEPSTVSEMETERLKALGWRPRGMAGLAPVLRQIADARRRG